MKRLLLLIVVAAIAFPSFAEKNPADYPLKIQVLETHWNRNGFGAQGWGRGNIKDGESINGFDYTFSCSAPFNASQGNASYPGRWKTEQQRLTILTWEVGGKGKPQGCELKTSVINDIYGMKDGHLITYTQAQFKALSDARKRGEEDLHPSDTDPAHYPLKVTILSADWQQANFGSSGYGKGNVRDGDHIEGFNFAATCAARFQPASTYLGKWNQGKARLVLMTKTVGENQFHNCELKTDSISGVYVRNNNSGSIVAMSQDEFKAWREKRKSATAQAPVSEAKLDTISTPTQQARGIGENNASITRLSVVSVPEGAEIEVDGNYVGSTPSTLELTLGDHAVTIRKAGFRTWERKLKLVNGDIKVHADLEKGGSR
jgi:hypothetical protein